MPQDESFRAVLYEELGGIGTLGVAYMAVASRYASFERIRIIRVILEQIRILIGFEQNDVAVFGKSLHAVIHAAQVRHYGNRTSRHWINDAVAD